MLIWVNSVDSIPMLDNLLDFNHIETTKTHIEVPIFPYVHVHIVWQTIALLCHGLLVDRFISDPFTVTPPGSPGSPGSASRHKMIRVIACYLPKYHST